MATTIVTKKGSGAPAASDLVEGELAVDTTNGRLYTENSSAAVVELGSNPSGNITFADDGKAIFGAGSDLQIYSDGSNSKIKESGAGSLVFEATNINLKDATGTDFTARFITGGDVRLFYDGSQKLATTSTGIDVTGTATMDGLTVGANSGGIITLEDTTTIATAGQTIGAVIFKGNDGSHPYAGTKAQIKSLITGSLGDGADLTFTTSDQLTNDITRLHIADNGDISFFEDTGTTAKLFWDASAESLGIGTSSPSQDLEILNGSTGAGIRLAATGTAYWDIERDATSGHLTFTDDGAGTVLTVGQDGNVGIGTSSPVVKLHTTSGVARTSTAKTETAFFATADDDDFRFGLAISHKGGTTDADRYASLDSTAYRISTDAFSTGGSLVLQELGGNVGIGASPSSHSLEVWRSGGEHLLLGRSGVGTYELGISSDNALTFEDAGSERMRIDSSGNVGIGTDSPSEKMQINDGRLRFLESSQRQYNVGIVSGTPDFAITDATYSVERMRIDSSGNWMLGTTDSNLYTSSTENGLYVTSTGQIRNSVGAVAAYLNRTGDDGDIVSFRKDGTTVGSIGTNNGIPYFLRASGGIAIGNSALLSAGSTGAINDAASDLGGTANRWKDAYLSGGVYLGGTAAANKLDDYEEGTWTPSLVGNTTGGSHTYSYQVGKYTKIGNTVVASFGLYITAKDTNMDGNVLVSGLPFSADMSTNVFAGLSVGWAANITYGDMLCGYIASGSSVSLRSSTSGSASSFIPSSYIGSASVYLFGTITYQVS